MVVYMRAEVRKCREREGKKENENDKQTIGWYATFYRSMKVTRERVPSSLGLVRT